MRSPAGRRGVGQRRAADEREPVAERDLVGLDHEALDGREHDRQRAAVVGDLLELVVGGVEALGVVDEVGGVGPHRGEERLQRGVGLRARSPAGARRPRALQVGGQVGQRGEALRGGGVGRQPREHPERAGR